MGVPGGLARVRTRPRVSWRTVALSLVWPVLWIAYTLIHGAVTGWYPYPFLDAAAIGYPRALTNTGVVVLLGIVLAVAFKLLDKLPTATRA